MTQRCLISFRKNVTEKDSAYDCIYDENSTLQVLLDDWLCYHKGFYIGPWKLNIRDKELFSQFMGDFTKIKDYVNFTSLDQCWAIYIDGVQVHENCPEWMDAIISEFLKPSRND